MVGISSASNTLTYVSDLKSTEKYQEPLDFLTSSKRLENNIATQTVQSLASFEPQLRISLEDDIELDKSCSERFFSC